MLLTLMLAQSGWSVVAGPGEKPMIMVNYKGEEKQIICQDEGYRQGLPQVI
jgi:hypothetical protein